MEDEKYVYLQDLREKKHTGYSARKQRSHCGKAGCKLPSDYLTKKEIKNMSGECKSYRLNEPMSIAEFRAMPDDIKVTYIKLIREKYNAPNTAIATMMGTNKDILYRELKKIGLADGKKGPKPWDKMGFAEWCYGVPAAEECQSVQEETSIEEMTAEEAEEILEIIGEEFAPTEPEKEQIPCCDTSGKQAECEPEIQFKKCIPSTGSMTYEGKTFNILSSLADLLGNANVVLSVKWDVMED